MVEYNGMIEKDGVFYCEKCDADLSKSNSVTPTMYLDGEEFFTHCYRCNNCGAELSITEERI